MSYDHKLVSVLHQPNEVGAPYGLSPYLSTFFNAICRSVRGIQMGVCSGCKTRLGLDGNREYREAYLYFEGQQYALLKIGYGDYSVKRNSENTYMVNSRQIENNKYNDTSSQYSMVCSTDVDKAVKNVKKYLKAYNLHEIADFSVSNFQYQLTTVVTSRSNEAFSAWADVRNDDSLKAELRALVETDYQFTSTALREKIVTWMGKEGEKKHGLQESRWVTYVQVRELMGEQVLETVQVPDVSRYHSTRQQPVVIKTSEADPELLAKLSVINMTEPDNYVEGVGIKVTDNSFWVEK